MWILICLAIVLIILLVVCNQFYRMAVCNGRKPFLSGNKDLPESFLGGVWAEGREWLDKAEKVSFSIKSHDKLNLKAFLIPSSKAGQKVFVITAHGYNSKGLDMGAYAKIFNEELDFNVLIPDDRGHGQSDGKYIGFGWHDRLDYIDWMKFLIKAYGQDIQILLFGVSMGGATVLMLSGEDLPTNVKAIISDCAYTSAKDILTYQLKRQYGLPPFPFIPVTSLICKIRAGYRFGEASALKQVGKAKVPVFFIHGSSDTFVPFEMAHRLYDACGSDKKLMVVEDAGHAESILNDYNGYCEAVKTFARAAL